MILINLKEKALIDNITGDIVRPACWDDLIPYYQYLLGRNHKAFADSLLERVFNGERVISKMIEHSQKRRGQ